MRRIIQGRVAAGALAAVIGCGGFTADAMQMALGQAARAHVAIDTAFATQYEQAREQAREQSATWEERDAALAKWEAARSSLGALRSALLAAEGASAADAVGAAACVAEAMSRLRNALRDVGLDPPAISSSAEAALRKLEGSCQ